MTDKKNDSVYRQGSDIPLPEGWAEWHLGGGCMAWGRNLRHNGSYACITGAYLSDAHQAWPTNVNVATPLYWGDTPTETTHRLPHESDTGGVWLVIHRDEDDDVGSLWVFKTTTEAVAYTETHDRAHA